MKCLITYTYVKILNSRYIICHCRGQESAGIVTSVGNGKFCAEKGMGLVNTAFTEDNIRKLRGRIGIGLFDWLFQLKSWLSLFHYNLLLVAPRRSNHALWVAMHTQLDPDELEMNINQLIMFCKVLAFSFYRTHTLFNSGGFWPHQHPTICCRDLTRTHGSCSQWGISQCKQVKTKGNLRLFSR